MYCNKCGAQSPNEAVFCKKCGAPIGEQPNAIETVRQKPKVNIPMIAVLSINTIAVSIIAVFVFVLSSSLNALEVKVNSLDRSVTYNPSSNEKEVTSDSSLNDPYNIKENSGAGEFNSWMAPEDDYVGGYETEKTDYEPLGLTANDFLGTWSFINYKTEETVTFYSDGTFSGSIPAWYILPEKMSLYTLNNGKWSFLEQEQVLSVLDIMYSFSPEMIPVTMSGDTLVLNLKANGDDTVVLTKVK